MNIAKMSDADLERILNGESGHWRPIDTEEAAAELEARDHSRRDPSAGAAFGHFPS